METQTELHDGVDPVTECGHTLETVEHLPVLEDYLLVVRLDSERKWVPKKKPQGLRRCSDDIHAGADMIMMITMLMIITKFMSMIC